MEQNGYDNHNGPGLQREGIKEPIQPKFLPKMKGLGCKPLKLNTPITKLLWVKTLRLLMVSNFLMKIL